MRDVLIVALMVFFISIFATIVLLTVPWSRRRLAALAEQVAEWHEKGLKSDA